MIRKYQLLFLTLIVPTVLMTSACIRSDEKNGEKTHSHEQGEIYTCPMHPEIRQNQPGNCPICHMKLVKVESGNEVEKKADVDLNVSPYQADLIGINPIEVVKKQVNYTIPVSGRVLSSKTVALQVFQKDLRYIKSGAKFSGQTEVDPAEISGEIISIDNFVDPTSRTVRVVGGIGSSNRNILSEASFTGQIEVDLGIKPVVPERAILFTGRGDFVYRYNDNTLRPQKVILGPKVSEEFVVLKGVDEGDKISSGPNFLIDSESKIRGLDDQKHH